MDSDLLHALAQSLLTLLVWLAKRAIERDTSATAELQAKQADLDRRITVLEQGTHGE